MRLLILAAAFAAPASTPAAPPAALSEARPPALASAEPGKECRRPDVVQARPTLRPQMKPLGELPPGDVVLTVYHQVDGCMEPVIVRYGVGGGGRR